MQVYHTSSVYNYGGIFHTFSRLALPCLFHLLMVVGNGGEQRVRMVNLMGFRLLIKMERESRVVFS